MEKRIQPLGETWSARESTAEAIAAWERASDSRLPEDYRAFMTEYNGGRPYPPMFDMNVPGDVLPSDEAVTYLDPLYAWEMVEDHAGDEGSRRSIPRDFLRIGSNPGDVEILLSLDPATHGQVHIWFRSPSAFGTDDNTRTYLQSETFRGFLDSLYENDDAEGMDYWYTPDTKTKSRPLAY